MSVIHLVWRNLMSRKSMFCKEYFWQILVTIGGLFVIFVTLLIGAFLVYKGSDTFWLNRHIGDLLI